VGPIFLDFWIPPVARTPTNFGRKNCFSASYSPSPSFIPNVKVLASMVAKINRGSQIFLDAPLARTHANFGPKSCSSVSYSPSPSCIPNLKLLASTVAEINRVSKIFFGCSPSTHNFIHLWKRQHNYSPDPCQF